MDYDFSEGAIKDELISMGFEFFPFKTGKEIKLPVTIGSYGNYVMKDQGINIIVEITGSWLQIADGRPNVNQVYFGVSMKNFKMSIFKSQLERLPRS